MDASPPDSWSEKSSIPSAIYIALFFFSLFAVFCVYTLSIVIFTRDGGVELAVIAALLPFPVGVVLFLHRNYIYNPVTLTVSLRDITTHRAGEVGLYFANSRVIPIAQLFMALGLFPTFLFFTITSFQSNEASGVAIAIVLLLFSLFFGVVLINSMYRSLFPQGLLLNGDGIWYSNWLVNDFERWENISAVYPLKFSRAIMAIVRYENVESNLHRSRLTFIDSLEKELYPWFVIITNNLAGSPILPFRMIQFYLDHPDVRVELNSNVALNRFSTTADDA